LPPEWWRTWQMNKSPARFQSYVGFVAPETAARNASHIHQYNFAISLEGYDSGDQADLAEQLDRAGFEIITRSRSVALAVSSRSDLDRLSISLLQNEMPLPRPVRLLGVSLSSPQGDDQEESQLGFPI
jgi:hypothetical protein